MTPVHKIRECSYCKCERVFILKTDKPRESFCGVCGTTQVLDGDKVQVNA